MRHVYAIALILAAIWGGKQLYSYWKQIDSGQAGKPASAQVSPQSLPGLPPDLEPKLQFVMQQGTKSFRRWLDYYRPRIEDPRLGWIELDYVLMVSEEDPEEARQVFQAVKHRTPTNSPVYARLKQLARTYE